MIFYSLFVFLLIGSAFTINKLIVQIISINAFVFLRMGISGLMLLIIYCKKKDLWIKANNKITNLLIISFFTTFIPSILRAFSLQHISSSRAAFWGSFEPFVTAIYLYFIFSKPLKKNQLFGCIIGFIGAVVFIILNNKSSFSFTLNQFPISIGDSSQILSIFFSRYGWMKAQELLQKNDFTPQQLNGFTFTISAILTLITSLIYSIISKQENIFSELFAISWNFELIKLLFYTIVIGNMLAYTLYGILLKKHNASYVATAGLSVPLFVHFLGYFFLNEEFSTLFFIPLSFIFFALYIFHKK